MVRIERDGAPDPGSALGAVSTASVPPIAPSRSRMFVSPPPEVRARLVEPEPVVGQLELQAPLLSQTRIGPCAVSGVFGNVLQASRQQK